MGRKKAEIVEPDRRQPASILEALGVIGMGDVEPIVLAALIQQDPLLLIGPHGTGKSYLLNRLALALGLEHRHYNASLLNFDDLVGYPLPNGAGSLEYVQTPASIWRAQSVFLDEISRCRPDIQNKLFSIIHERRVQGLALDRLVYRWSAMNPPAADDADRGYSGSEPLDTALADRFAFVLQIPDWHSLPASAQEALILTRESDPPSAAARQLAAIVETGRALVESIRVSHGTTLARYVRMVCGLLRQSGLLLSPRRAVMLLRNIAGVHAARLLASADSDCGGSALLALRHSLPHRATGEAVKELNLLAAHKEAWKAAGSDMDDTLQLLIAEADPLRRALVAARCESLGRRQFSTVVADCLAALAPGSRHALAAELFESGAAGRLLAAVAEQAAEWYSVVATSQGIHETVQAGGPRHRVWQRVVSRLSALDKNAPDTASATNLLAGLFAQGELAGESDVDRVLASWAQARTAIEGVR
jgi:MoxR-like ATPase